MARIDAELSVGALLHRQVVIKSLVLEDPVLNMTSDPDGPWNFEIGSEVAAERDAITLLLPMRYEERIGWM